MLRHPMLSALAAVLLVAIAAGLEGAVIPAFGGWVLGIGAAVGLLLLWGQPLPQPSRRVALALLWLGGLLLFHALPVPPLFRRLVAPGQEASIAEISPESSGDIDGWLDALTRYDLDAALGLNPQWSYDLLVGAQDHLWRPLAMHSSGLPMSLVWWFAAPLLWLWGMRLGRSETGTRSFLVGMLLLGVAEAVFGLANRDGPSTGIGVKTYYLGSATGTFVNRGHFAAFLVMSLGCAWGLAASLFPLLPEEARRHARHRHRSSQPPSVLETAGDKLPRLVLLAFLAAVVAVGVVMARSRAPLVAITVAGALTGFSIWRKRKDLLHLGIGLGVPAAGVVLASAAFGLRGSLGRFWSVIWEDDSAISRLALWREGLPAWLEAPLFGWGPGGWGLAWSAHHQGAMKYDFPFAHSEPLQQLVELGLVGCLPLFFLLGRWLWSLRGLTQEDASPQAIGVLVGCLAVLLQSLVDFPLHIPGVWVPFCILCGLGSAGIQRPTVERSGYRAWVAVALLAFGLGGYAALRDGASIAQRSAHVSTMPLIWFEAAAAGPGKVDQWLPVARTQTERMPLDPWLHVTVAFGESLMAARADVEEHTYEADLSIARALKLRPADPRMLVVIAQIWLRLSTINVTHDAFQERAIQSLALAVSMDGWRAEQAFRAAEKLPVAALNRIRDAAPTEGREAARVQFEFAETIAKRGDYEGALASCKKATELDPLMGPPFFRAGEYARQLGRPAESQDWFRQFLNLSDKPLTMEAWALYYVGDMTGASSRFNRAVAESASNRWAWQGVAQVARDRGEPRNEIRALQRLVALGNKDPRILARIEELK